MKTKIIAVVFVSFVVALALRVFVIEGFVVRGDSMSPTILDGEYVFVDKLAYVHGTPQKGDIIVATPREYPGKIIKRVVGLPGDIVDFGDGKATNVDPKEYFVEGDNRAVSIDSRELGGMDAWSISGKAFGVINLHTWKYRGL